MKTLPVAVYLFASLICLSPFVSGQSVRFEEQAVPTPLSGISGVFVDHGGKIWFAETEANKIGVLVPGQPVLEIPIPSPDGGPSHFAEVNAPLGEIWYTETRANKVGNTNKWEVTLPTPASMPIGIADGRARATPTGALLVAWVAEFSGNKIARVYSDGTVKEYPVPTPDSGPFGIAAITGFTNVAEVWFTESKAGKIGRLSEATGIVTEYPIPTPNSDPREIVADLMGNLWFTEFNAGKIGRITPAGVLTEFPIGNADAGPLGIAAGSAGEIWFTEAKAGRIGVLRPDLTIKEFRLPSSSDAPTGIAIGTQVFVEHFAPPGETRLAVAEPRANRVAFATSDWLIISGAGYFGDWDTEVRISNPEGFSLQVKIFGASPEPGSVVVPASGLVKIVASKTQFAGWRRWVMNPNFFIPSVDARVFSRSRAGVSARLPAIRRSTLEAMGPQVLSFPAAQRNGNGARSNLFLDFNDTNSPVLVQIDVLGPDGSLVGAAKTGFFGTIYQTDVLATAGVAELQEGQVRVTVLAGTGIPWGYLATSAEDGSIAITLGADP